MPNSDFQVAIVGGGIGGLCLAQGLRKAGIGVAVYERDRVRDERLQGYRIHIDPHGGRALHRCLPPALWEAFVATCGNTGGKFRFLTDQMEELLAFEPPDGADPIERHRSASRITLRQVLLSGLDDVVHFDKEFVRYVEQPDGHIALCFADGSTATCDLLIGADGGNSRVRKQFLPQARRIDTGVVGIAGKLMLTEENRRKAPPSLLRGAGLVMAPGHRTMFIALQEFGDRARPAEGAIGGNDAAHALDPGTLFDNTTSYLMWAYGGYREEIQHGRALEDLTHEELKALTIRLIARWHPDFHEMTVLSDPDSLTVLPIRTSVPVGPWRTKRVTMIGDAIHSMTPYRGIGGNVALRDASLLCANLIGALNGEHSIEAAVRDYENKMRDYGFAAVRGSMRAMRRAVSKSNAGFRITKLMFRAINRLPPLKRRFLANFADD
jgi:salicylate hydroxylase